MTKYILFIHLAFIKTDSLLNKLFRTKPSEDFTFTTHIFSLTLFYGRTDWEDDTFVSTQWICPGFLPIYPLGSYRLSLKDEDAKYDFLGLNNTYKAFRKEKLCKKQVIKTYLVWYGPLAIIALALLALKLSQ